MPVRSALLGAALAVAVIVATVTFGSGLATLDSHPTLYGWNWSVAIKSGGHQQRPARGRAPPGPRSVRGRMDGYWFANAQLDGQTVPVLLTEAHAALGPPILSGHAVDANDQIVLGAATLAQLHKKVGDTVLASYGAPKDAPVYIAPTPLLIVGTATMPAIGVSGHLHPSMGTGALLPTGVEPAAMKRALTDPDPNLDGPIIDVVRLKKGVSPAAGRASLQRIVAATDKVMAADPNGEGDTYALLSVQRPAEIVNYQSTGSTPALLGLRTRGRRSRGPRPHPRRVSAAKATRAGIAQDTRLHTATTGCRGGLAGVGGGARRDRRRRAGRHRGRTLALDSLCPGHLRRSLSFGPGRPGRRGGPRYGDPGQPLGGHPRSDSGPYPDGACPASRVNTLRRRNSGGLMRITKNSRRTIRAQITCGVVAAPLFITAFTAIGVKRPGYDVAWIR